MSEPYGDFELLHYWAGRTDERNERWLSSSASVADGIVRDLHPTSVLDAGCAMGFLVEALRQRGVDAADRRLRVRDLEVDESVASTARSPR